MEVPAAAAPDAPAGLAGPGGELVVAAGPLDRFAPVDVRLVEPGAWSALLTRSGRQGESPNHTRLRGERWLLTAAGDLLHNPAVAIRIAEEDEPDVVGTAWRYTRREPSS